MPVVELPHETLSEELRAQLRSGQFRRVLVIGQGTAAVAGQSLVAALQRGARPVPRGDGGGAARHRAVGLPAGVGHGGHARGRDQPERHHHGHQPHGGPGPGPGRQDPRHREPAQQRPRRPHRRRALHVGRPRRRDERRVDQGVLRAGRGRIPARVRPGRRADRGLLGRSGHAPPRVAGPADRDGAGARAPGRDRRRRSAARARSALLGCRRQRLEPDRGARGADQALRALLQVDRVRRHRGQEAHRPVRGAFDHRVRRRALRLQRGRRREGARDLPRAQGRGGRGRGPGRRSVQRRARDDRGPAGPSGTRLRALRDGRPPVRLRGGPGDRRVGPSAPRGPGRDRSGRHGIARAEPGRARAPGPAARRAGDPLLRSAPGWVLRRLARGRHCRAARVPVPVRHPGAAARRVPRRVRQGRHAGHRRRGSDRRVDRRDRRARRAPSTRSSTRRRR